MASTATATIDGRSFEFSLEDGFLTITEGGQARGGVRVDPVPAPPPTVYFVPDPEVPAP